MMSIEELLGNPNSIENLLVDLDDLCLRLQEDYNDNVPFVQTEEDRMAVVLACELLEHLLEKAKEKEND